MVRNYYLAVDIGASSGRHMLAHIDEGKMVLEEIHRFSNAAVEKNGHMVWDVDRLFGEILKGMKKCASLGKNPVSMGVDTWGVDYVLLDKDNKRPGDTFSYRDKRTAGVDKKVYEYICEEELYKRTGIEKILAEPYDKELVKPCVESKVFGIGVESYTVGSAEFTLSFAALHEGCMPLMDNGHYHPLEYVSDKIPAMLCFYLEFALHITRGVRWDSDHVLLLDDETKEMAKEIVRNNALNRVYMALDYFDASINRISALATGFRSWQKALLWALCTPNEMLKELQDTNQFTKLMVMQEAVKMLPIGEVWDEYCKREGVAGDLNFYDEVERYEREVLSKRA